MNIDPTVRTNPLQAMNLHASLILTRISVAALARMLPELGKNPIPVESNSSIRYISISLQLAASSRVNGFTRREAGCDDGESTRTLR